VSQRAFQTALARLVTEADFRERARSEGETTFDSDLTALERRRLARLSRDHGLKVTAALVTSYRLGKILTLLPLTRVLLGDDRLVRELTLFWSDHPPTSFYAVDESIAFCEHLQQRRRSKRVRVNYLEDVVAYEHAVLQLQRPRPTGERAPPQRVRFHHDPAQLLTCLGAGRRPRAVAELRCVATGSVADDGTIDWSLVSDQQAVGT
jgi:hypothetical protein